MIQVLNSRPNQLAAGLALAVIVLITALFIINPLMTRPLLWLYDLLVVLSASTCAALAALLWRSFEAGEVLKTIWGSLALGLVLWAVAEAIYAFYELILNQETPYPSLADGLWVPGYIPLFVALYLRFRSLRITPSRGQIAAAVIVFGALVGVSLWFVITPMIAEPDPNILLNILNILYPVGDLLVMLGVVLIVLVLSGGELSWPWILIAAGLFILAFGDSLFSYTTWNEVYRPDGQNTLLTALVDIPYLSAYIIMGFGLFVQARIQRLV